MFVFGQVNPQVELDHFLSGQVIKFDNSTTLCMFMLSEQGLHCLLTETL